MTRVAGPEIGLELVDLQSITKGLTTKTYRITDRRHADTATIRNT